MIRVESGSSRSNVTYKPANAGTTRITMIPTSTAISATRIAG
jgi:hypothetical protein